MYRNPRKPIILYFIIGALPTEAETLDASLYGNVCFRNVSKVKEDDNAEPCNFVAGAVTAPYTKFPRAPMLATATAPPAATKPAPKTPRVGGAKAADAPNGWGNQ